MKNPGVNLPEFVENLEIDCFKEKYDEDHLSKSNWLLVDEVTGIVLHSELNYTLSGIDLSNGFVNIYPLMDV